MKFITGFLPDSINYDGYIEIGALNSEGVFNEKALRFGCLFVPIQKSGVWYSNFADVSDYINAQYYYKFRIDFIVEDATFVEFVVTAYRAYYGRIYTDEIFRYNRGDVGTVDFANIGLIGSQYGFSIVKSADITVREEDGVLINRPFSLNSFYKGSAIAGNFTINNTATNIIYSGGLPSWLGGSTEPIYTFKYESNILYKILEYDVIYGDAYVPVSMMSSITYPPFTLYQNSAEANRIDKSNFLTVVKAVNGTFRDSLSITDITVEIEYDVPINFNYVYIENLGRYYYVMDYSIVRQGFVELTLAVDVLMSNKDAILNLTAFVDRNEFDYDPLVADSRIVVEEGVNIDHIFETNNYLWEDTAYNEGNYVLNGYNLTIRKDD